MKTRIWISQRADSQQRIAVARRFVDMRVRTVGDDNGQFLSHIPQDSQCNSVLV
ncbi:MAG TPA: hypothetical protein VET48_09580 [Steroidobacteraceae bacterium]|nr:hypothetical protein [Steroidobacteraceae bacterium]